MQVTLLVPIDSGAAPKWEEGICSRQGSGATHSQPAACTPSARRTLVPTRRPAALGAAIDARPLRYESTMAQLIQNAPEIQAPLVGYHGAWGGTVGRANLDAE